MTVGERRSILRRGLLRARFVALVIVATAASASAAGAASPRAGRVAILPIAADGFSPEVCARMASALAGGLAASGVEDVVNAAETARRMTAGGVSGCRTPSCIATIGRLTEAALLIQGAVTVKPNKLDYELRLDLITAAGAATATVGTMESRCEGCSLDEVLEDMSLLASSLRVRHLSDLDGPVAPTTDEPPGAVRPVLAPAFSSAAEAGVRSPPPRRALWWSAVGVGALSVGAGAYLMVIDGRCVDDAGVGLCSTRIGARTAGIAVAGGGAMVAALGAYHLIRGGSRAGPDAVVSLAPTSFAVTTRF